MRARNQSTRPGLRWLEADVRDKQAHYGDCTFDTAIDKSTLDAVCDGGRDAEASRYVAEVARVLRPGGAFLIFSYAPPNTRLHHLELMFNCSVEVAGERCFAYVCTHRQGEKASCSSEISSECDVPP